MYKLLLAEDETAAREGILAGIPWEKLGIGRVETAKNGVLALEAAKSFRPDILLTDIKMPRMNGIELAQAVRRLNPDCSILILSGYPEVDYLKSAISLKVVDFVEKPVQLSVLENKIRDAVAMQDSVGEKSRLRRLELASALAHPFCSAGQVACSARALFQLPESGPIFVRVRFLRVLTEDGSNVPEEALPEYQRGVEAQFRGRAAAVGLCGRMIQMTEFGAEPLPEDGDAVLRVIKESFADRLFFLAEGESVGLEDYAKTFEGASEAAALVFYDRTKPLWSFRDLPREKEPFDPDFQTYRKLFGDGKREELKRFAKGLAKRAAGVKLSPKEASACYFRMFSLLSHRGKEQEPPVQADSADELLGECVFLDRMEDWLEKEIDACFQSIRLGNSANTLAAVLAFVNGNYQRKDLSLKQLSQKFYLSEPYLCVRFREETGKTFIQYLTELRIEKSLPLLADGEHKIQEIAVRVGFDNGNYFSKIFKRQQGISPKDFRKRFGIS